jgi:hypothetical protein
VWRLLVLWLVLLVLLVWLVWLVRIALVLVRGPRVLAVLALTVTRPLAVVVVPVAAHLAREQAQKDDSAACDAPPARRSPARYYRHSRPPPAPPLGSTRGEWPRREQPT